VEQIRKHGGNINEASEKYNIPEDSILDFSANINPFGPPPQVYEAIKNNIKKITQYPDSRNLELKKSLANHLNITKNNLMMGNGASELIFLIVNNLRPGNVWLPVPTFAEYQIASASIGANIFHLPLQEYFTKFDVNNLKKMKKGDLFFICNPNNPTGQLYAPVLLEEVFQITQKKEAFMVVDESFLDFIENKSEISYINKAINNQHLIILYSLTKFFAIPGLRLGAMIAHSTLISQFEKIRDPWNINVFAQIAGQVALKDEDYINETLSFFQQERDYLYNSLKRIKGLVSFKPSANYIFIKLLEPNTSTKIFEKLAQQGILVRNCNSYPLLGENYIRIAIRNRVDNLKLIEKLRTILD